MIVHFWALAAVAAAVQGLLLSAVLFSRKENRWPNRLLGLLLLLLGLTLIEWALWWTGGIERARGLAALSFGFPLLYGPLLFLFFKTTFEPRQLSPKDVLHLLPFAATVFFMLPFYLRFWPALAQGLDWIPRVTRWPAFPLAIFGQMIAYGIWIPVRFARYFDRNDGLKRWRRWLLFAYWGIVLTFIFYRLLPLAGLTAPAWKYVVACSLTFFIYFVAWLGYIEPKVFAGWSLPDAIRPGKYPHSTLRPGQSDALYRQLCALLETEQLYRESRISLEEIAVRLNAQRHHVSQAVNEQAGKSFPALVNEYRIREAQALLAATSKQELNAIEVAYRVGFGTKNAFNRSFKQHTGMTPTAYREAFGK